MLLDKGQPVADATVYLVVNAKEWGDGCPDTAASVKTTAKGEFKFDRRTYHQEVLPFASTRTDRWRVCYARTDGKQAVWNSSGSWGGPPVEDLRCDVNPSTAPNANPCTKIEH